MDELDTEMVDLFGSDIASIASTTEPEYDSDEDWEVKAVLAERDINSETKYLIEWEGFPLWEASWEPAENLNKAILMDWQETKQREGHERESRLKIGAWRKAIVERLIGKDARHRERNRKRVERGLSPTTYDWTLEEHLAALDEYPKGEGEEEEDKLDNAVDPKVADASADILMSSPRGASNVSSPRSPPSHSPDDGAGTNKRRPKPLARESTTNSIAEDESQPSPSSSPLFGPPLKAPKRRATDSIPSASNTQMRKASSSTPASKYGQPPSVKLPAQNSRAGQSAMPKTAVQTGAVGNVFSGGQVRKKKKAILDAAKDPNKEPQVPRKRYARIVEKGRRDREGVVAPLKPNNPIWLDPNVRERKLREEALRRAAGVRPQTPPETDVNAVAAPEDFGEDTPMEGINNGEDAELDINQGKKKFLRFDDTVTYQEHPALDSEESLFIPDSTPVPDTPVFKVKDEGEESKIVWAPPLPSMRELSLPGIRAKFGTQDLVKKARIGPTTAEPIFLTFVGIPRNPNLPWLNELEDQEILDFTHICLAQDFLFQHGDETLTQTLLCEGRVTSPEASDRLERIADRLRLSSTGVIRFSNNEFFVLLYPSVCREWGSDSSQGPEGAESSPPLKYSIFRLQATFQPTLLAPVSASSELNNEDSPSGTRPMIFHRFFGLDYNVLLPSAKQKTTSHHFFLAFPKFAGQEACLLSHWLRSCNPECKISTSLSPGSWYSFVKLGHGVVILHEDAVWAVRSFPNFYNMLHSANENLNFWLFNKSLQPSPMFPRLLSGEPESTPVGHIHMQQIFLPGIAIFITPSFFLSQPLHAYQFLKWFWQRFVKNSEPQRRGRLVLCANIVDWLFDLAIEKADKRTQHLKQGLPPEVQMRFNTHAKAVEAYYKTWNLIRSIIDNQVDDEDCAVISTAPENIDGNDEQSLVNWFGWWSIMHLHRYRKFTILGSNDPEVKRLARRIKPPCYSSSVVNSVDRVYEALDLEEQLQGLNTMDAEETVSSSSGTRLVSSDHWQHLTKYLAEVAQQIPNIQWCPIVMYKFPVSYWNSDMSFHFRDYTSKFASYRDCFNYFLPFQPNKGYHNTNAAFCYTIEGPWNPSAYPSDIPPVRRPWIILYRPMNPHKKPWTVSELLIWDISADPKIVRDEGKVYEHDLIPAQQELIQFVRNESEAKNLQFPLQRVWIGGFNAPPTGFTHPLDATLKYLSSFIKDLKQWAPAPHDKILGRGWTIVMPGAAPDSAPARSGLISLDPPKEPKPTETKIIFHPPRAESREHASKCNNRLFTHTRECGRRGHGIDEMDYVFRPTMEWYAEQQADGRGFDHIKVTPWETVFQHYGITDPNKPDPANGQK